MKMKKKVYEKNNINEVQFTRADRKQRNLLNFSSQFTIKFRSKNNITRGRIIHFVRYITLYYHKKKYYI